MTSTPQANQPSTLPPLALVGIGSLFPKAASTDEFWQLIKNGVDAITEIPETHWRPEDYYSADQKKPDFTYGNRGGFIDPYPFDPMKYGVPPNALEATDTSQLLGMVVADEAMRDAGYGPDRDFNRDRTSVILGVTGALELVIPLGARLGHPMWREAMLEAGLTPAQADDIVERIGERYVPWQENSFPGLLGNVVAGRISKYLNTGGTNCVVDAACASSLSALEMAALELATGKADMVLTGGVDTFNDIFMYMCFSKTPALSPTGDARPFADGCDGTILGEGLGICVLKRLDDAERDGDRVYAVIRGIGSSSDGKGDAIYAPSSPGQVKALRNAYTNADVAPETVELLEAHGTGTARGDAVETTALREVYGDAATRSSWCALGSIKSQIGHTKSAAGAAGLIKAALALHHKVLPPTCKVERPAETVAPGASALYVNTHKRPWLPRKGHPRRAGISSFGFGGSNFHLVLEEYRPEKTAPDWDGRVQLLAFSGAHADDIRKELDAFDAKASRDDVRAQAKASRDAFNADDAHRLVIVVEQGESDVATVLENARKMLIEKPDTSWSTPDGAYYGVGEADGEVAVLFPGQGAQYPDMLIDLACQFPEMLDALDAANDVVGENERRERLSDVIYPHPAFDKDTRSAQAAALTETDVAQPALGAVSSGAWDVLARRFGLEASRFAGHSYGELVALHAAGAFDTRGLAVASKRRGELMAGEGGDRGTMLAVRASSDAIQKVLGEGGIDLVLANKNTPEQTVLSGSRSEIERATAAFKEASIPVTPLNVAAAFHSAYVAEASEPFAHSLTEIEMHSPTATVYGNTNAAPYPNDPGAIREQLAAQLANPVEFVKEIERMHADGVRTFVEVGPGARLSGMVGRILGDAPHRCIALDASNGKKDGIADLGRLIAALAAEGRRVALSAWDEGFTPKEDTAGKSRMTVPICGANYRPERSKPTPRRAVVNTESRTAEANTAHTNTPLPPSSKAERPISHSKEATEKRVAESESHAAENTRTPRSVSADDANGQPLLELYRQTQASLAAFQQMQEQTARLHSEYLKGQETATQTFQELLRQQHRMFSHLAGGETIPTMPTAPAPATPPMRSPRAEETREAAPSSPPTPEPTVAPTPERAAESVDLTPILMEVVAEKTGYPDEMLELDMALDADLGIDSIKRVEILSAIQERVPTLPSLEAEELGAIQTLGDIVKALDDLAPAASPESVAPPVGGSIDTGELERVLVAVVAEKTGYPEEMLELDMALDADLGIDSIKRVEILSAMQEQLPELPTLEAEALNAIQTLRDVLDELAKVSTGSVPTESASTPSAGADELATLLLEVVAEKTGYPVEMLEPGMAMDADLGIDSIKRVEILSALQERLPGLRSLDGEEVGNLVTLGDILSALAEEATAPRGIPQAQVAATPVPNTDRDGGDRLVRRVLALDPIGPTSERSGIELATEGEIAVVADESAFADHVVGAFQASGYDAIHLAHDELESHPALRGLVVIAPDGVDRIYVKDVFGLVQQAGPALRQSAASGGALLATVTRLDGGFGLRHARSLGAPEAGALAGLAKTAALEWPEVTVRAVDLAPELGGSLEAAQRLVDELLHEAPVEIGLAPDTTATVRMREAEVSPAHALPIADNDVYLVTGGARGVTAAVAVALAEAGVPRVALLGRTELTEDELAGVADDADERAIKKAIVAASADGMTPQELERAYQHYARNREIRETLDAIQGAGADVRYLSADVRDAESVRNAVRQIESEWGPVTGIVHGAGVLADKRIEDKTPDQVDLVYDTKVAGLQNILDATNADHLRYLALFSSSTGRFGRVGQVDYAMANEALNKMARAESAKRPGCRVVSVNWGPWAGGMVTPALRGLFAKEGVGLIGLKEGAAYLIDELRSDDSSVEVVLVAEPRGARSASPKAPLKPVFTFPLDISRYPFLESHVLDGRAVLPVAIYIEWMTHAALHAHPGLRFVGIEDLRVLKGLIIDNGSEVFIELATGPLENGRVAVELHSRTEDGGEVVHASATVRLDATFTDAPDAKAPDDLPPFQEMAQSYYGEGALFHGPDFQGITNVEACGDGGIVVRAETNATPGDWIRQPMRSRWLANPLAIDCAFQALILWSLDRFDAGSLPVHFESYTQYQSAFPKEGVRIAAVVQKSTPHSATADIDFVHPQTGELVARMTGYECVVDRSLNEAFARNRLDAPSVEH